MDDFIDDSDAKIDISAEIRNIFGYDRRKFKDEVITLISYTRSTVNILHKLCFNLWPVYYFYISNSRGTLMIGLWKTIDLPT